MPTNRLSGLRGPVLLLAVALGLAACGDDGTGPDDRIVEGVNLTTLFAPAGSHEMAAVLRAWDARRPAFAEVRVEEEHRRRLDGRPGTLRVVSIVSDGNRHYGGIQAVNDAPPGSLPVLLVAHGGDGGTSVLEMDIVSTALGDLAARFVLVAPAFRSEPFDGARVYRSEGEPSPWDRDVDDAFSFIQAVPEVVPAADPERLTAVGFSRGGGVVLLMGIRDPSIDQVIEFFGPTDMLSEWVEDIVADALTGSLADLPGVSDLDTQVIQPLRRGETSLAEARLELIRRSPVLFAHRLPETQLHHGTADRVVPVAQAEALIRAMTDLGRTPPDFESYLYPGSGHDPITLLRALDRTRAALLRFLDD